MKKIISLLLVAVMLVGFAPVAARADDPVTCSHTTDSKSTYEKDSAGNYKYYKSTTKQNCHSYKCTVCGKLFGEIACSNKAADDAASDNDKTNDVECGSTLICDVCGYGFEYHPLLRDDAENVVCIPDSNNDNCHYVYCTVCGKWVKKECTNSHINSATNCGETFKCDICGQTFTYHKSIEWINQTTEGNCYWHCTACNNNNKGVPHAHYYGEKVTVTIGGETKTYGLDSCCGLTCLKCGNVRDDAPHKVWVTKYDKDQHWQECSECGEISKKENHTGGTATCLECAKCEVCGAYYGDKSEEHQTDGIYKTNSKTHWLNCIICGKEIESADHTFTDWHRYSSTMQSRECSVCLYSEKRTFHEYTVSFNNNGHGARVNAQSVIWGNCAKNPGTLREDGYTFVGWYADSDCKYEYDFTEPIEADTVIYAKWKPAEYTISYKEKDGTAFKGVHETDTYPRKHTYDKATALQTAVEDGYDWQAWYLSPEYKTEELVTKLDAYKYTSNISLYAKLTPHTYYVNYDKNNSESTETMNNSTHVYGTASRLSKNKYTRVGYSLSGWSEYPNGPKVYEDGDEILNLTTENKKTVILYAKWSPVVYEIKYYDQGGTEFTGDRDDIPSTHTYGTETSLVNAHRTGYVFGGWFTDKDCKAGTEKYKLGATEYTEDNIVLYAKWTPRQNYISYYPNGSGVSGSMENQSYSCDEAVTLNENKYKRSGYTYFGWSLKEYDENTVDYTDKQSDLMLLSDTPIQLFAVWGKNCSVTLVTNGGKIAEGKNVTSYTHKVGVSLPTAADVTKDGYSFYGWYENSDFSGTPVTAIAATETGNKTYYAKWGEKRYTVTFNLVSTSSSTTTSLGTASYTIDGGTAVSVTTAGSTKSDLTGNEVIKVTAAPSSSYYAKIYTDSKTLATSSKGTAVTYEIPADLLKTNPTIKIAFSTNPYTGDDFDTMLWVIAMASAGAGAAITIAKKKSHN